ncbi:alpha,alpha-trehalose-phosphate synthase (UDP-forming) [Ammonifex thiophilus]|uniref:Glucosylglycerol-phosphate synthase n=1 Tax=Ammonifex thiophilus TaxID=444093 RepID=A0A3D8P0T9_9THEO|nr:trehalose-6-phosphate synthase [Ammonifex thiophilus]RDV80721.1 trehalose-6-phosphate synthase [Ammonifex thiophilus]
MATVALRFPSKVRLVVVSNRGPFVLKETATGVEKQWAVSGLVSAIMPLFRTTPGTWVAWGGRFASEKEAGTTYQEGNLKWVEVPLTRREVELYYDGFANQVMWPLCHHFLEKCVIDPDWWTGYREVNRKFAHLTGKVGYDADLIWVHDYHLALVPSLLRQQAFGKDSPKIGLFWHIPFPGPDTWEVIPWSKEIIEGLLGADVIAFHVPKYVENFLQCVRAFTDATLLPGGKLIFYQGRVVEVQAIPVGVNQELFSSLGKDPEIRRKAELIREQIGGEKLLLGVERLDYSKGVLDKLSAFERFLEKHPEYHGRVTLLQIAVPTRNGIGAYTELRRRVEALVGRINGRFSTPAWTPVRYFYRSFDQKELAAFYLAADVALVTPLRDGLNLVAAEYVVTKGEKPGVLVLSRLAGIACHLREALLVNPYNPEDMVEAIRQALEMPVEEQKKRLQALQQKLARWTAATWVRSFLKTTLEHRAEYSVATP